MSETEELISAIKSGDLETVQGMIEKGMDVGSVVDEDGDTALFWSIKRNQDEISVELIKAGCDVNQRRKGFGVTLPAFCAGFKKVKQLELLLDNGADPSLVDEENFTTLYVAVAARSEAAVELLIKAGADLNYLVGNGKKTVLDRAVDAGNDKIVEMIKEAGGKTAEELGVETN